MKNDGTRDAFAGFLRRLAAGKVGGIEWERFIVQHYADEFLEDIRRRVARLTIAQHGGLQWSDSELAALQQWSRELRQASDEPPLDSISAAP
jgi:hypothetical protein